MHNIPQTEGKAAAVGFTGGAGERSGQKDASDRPVRKNGDNSYSGGFADEPSEQALLSGLTGADRSFDPFEKTSLLGGSGFINADDLFAPGRSAGLSGSLSGDRPAAENRPDGAFGMFEDGMALGADPSGGGLTRGGIFENNAAGDSSFEDGMALNGGLAGDREFADPDAGKTDEQVFFDADTLPDGYRPHEEELRSGETELLDGIRQWRQGMDEWRRGMEQWRQGIDEWRGAQPAGSAGGQNLTENAGRTVTVIGSTSSKDPANVGAADDPRMSGGAGTPAMLPDVQYPEMSYAQFLMQNRCSGTLKVQAYAAQQSIPLSGVDIIVSRRFSDGVHVFFTGRTDSSGIIDNISLPAPSRDLSLESGSRMPAAIYDLTARIAGLRPISYTFDIFDSVETIQSIILRSFVR